MDLRDFSAWRYVGLPVRDETTTWREAATSLVPIVNQAIESLCQNVWQCDSVEVLEDHETFFLTMVVIAFVSTLVKAAQVLL